MEMAISESDIVLITQVRDEAARLPFFLQHYRQLGINKFLIIDNGSTDQTGELLASDSDVTLFGNRQRYAGAWQVIKPILDAYCKDRWCLHADADELLLLPGTSGLHELRERMVGEGATALRSYMVDMYSSGPIKKTPVVAGEDLFLRCPYFDPPTRGQDGIIRASSPRARLFGLYPNLVKTPLFLYGAGVQTTGPGSRTVHEMANVKLSKETGILAHFKFQEDLFWKTSRAILENSYWNDSAEYKHLAPRLREDSVPYYYRSLHYKEFGDFEAAGFACATAR